MTFWAGCERRAAPAQAVHDGKISAYTSCPAPACPRMAESSRQQIPSPAASRGQRSRGSREREGVAAREDLVMSAPRGHIIVAVPTCVPTQDVIYASLTMRQA